jgi:hypothetical protein
MSQQKHQPFEYDSTEDSIEPCVVGSESESSLESRVESWVASRCGRDQMSVQNRAIRLLEEAVEVCQSAGISRDMIVRQVDHVFARPAGEIIQEVGGVAVCLLGLCAALKTKFSSAAMAEIERIEAKPVEEVRGSLARKADADLVVFAAEPERGNPRLVTLERFRSMTPREQGYYSYMQADWPGSELKGHDSSPYEAGTIQDEEFRLGQMLGVQEAQDSEE